MMRKRQHLRQDVARAGPYFTVGDDDTRGVALDAGDRDAIAGVFLEPRNTPMTIDFVKSTAGIGWPGARSFQSAVHSSGGRNTTWRGSSTPLGSL